MKDYYRSMRACHPNSLRRRLRGQERRTALVGWALILFVSTGILPLRVGEVFAQAGKSPKSSPGAIDEQRLVGRWVRPDGGYLLEIRTVHKEGSAEAAYFNPKPVKVFQAIWTSQDGKVKILVELRDVNYPGSTYNLEYDPKSDRLRGTYFQAVEKQTYAVHFVRAK